MQTNTNTTSTDKTTRKPAPQPRNGVDVPTFFATIDAVRQQPALAAFRFRASNRWLRGTHSRTTLEAFSGAGGEHVHAKEMAIDTDHPPVLCGDDEGASPTELLMAGLAGCLTAGIVNIASARGVNLTEVESHVEGDIDLRGILGIDPDVRNGFSALRVRFRLRGDADAEQLRKIVEQSRERSAVFDVLTNGTSVAIDVDAA